MKKQSAFATGKEVISCMQDHARNGGKSVFRQALEIGALAFGPGRISPKEYVFYRLYDDNRFTKSDKRRFVGKAAEFPISRILNNHSWYSISSDKLSSYILLSGMGFPIPEIKAVYHRYRHSGNFLRLQNPGSLCAFLRNPDIYPMFCKPIYSRHGIGAASLLGYDSDTDELIQPFGRRIDVASFAESVQGFVKGYLFQRQLMPHKALADICGDRIASLRLVVFLSNGVPHITHATWKIPASDSITDHFANADNLDANVDPESGVIIQAFRRHGLRQEAVTHHPDSGKAVTGFQIPHWQAARDLCLSASSTIPGLRLQAWDIAICEEGPVILEVNMGGDFEIQFSTGKGMLTPAIEQALIDSDPNWKKTVTNSIIKRSFAKILPKGRKAQPHTA